MIRHVWLSSLQGVPQRDKITAHRPQSANIRESIKWWRCHHSNGYWGQLVSCDHQAALRKGHPKIKLQTQFLVFERFETLIRKESLLPFHDNRQWITTHTFNSGRNECWPWHPLCTGSTQTGTQSKADHIGWYTEKPHGIICISISQCGGQALLEKGLHSADTNSPQTYQHTTSL